MPLGIPEGQSQQARLVYHPPWLRERLQRKYPSHVFPLHKEGGGMRTPEVSLRNLLALLSDEDLKYAANMRRVWEFAGKPDVSLNWPEPFTDDIGTQNISKGVAGWFNPYTSYFVSDAPANAPVGIARLFMPERSISKEEGVYSLPLHELGHATQFASIRGQHLFPAGLDQLFERFGRERKELDQGVYTTPETLEWEASNVLGEMLRDLLFREPLGSKESILPLRRTEPSFLDLIPNLLKTIQRVPEPPLPQ